MLAVLAIMAALEPGAATFREVNGLRLAIDNSCDVGCGPSAIAPVVQGRTLAGEEMRYAVEHSRSPMSLPWSDASLGLTIVLPDCAQRDGLSVLGGPSGELEVLSVLDEYDIATEQTGVRLSALILPSDYAEGQSMPFRVKASTPACGGEGEIKPDHVAALKAWAEIQYQEELTMNKEIAQ